MAATRLTGRKIMMSALLALRLSLEAAGAVETVRDTRFAAVARPGFLCAFAFQIGVGALLSE